MLFKIGALKNSAIFTGMHLDWRLSLIKLKKETTTQQFSCEYCEIFKNRFSYRTPLAAASGTTRSALGYSSSRIIKTHSRGEVRILSHI